MSFEVKITPEDVESLVKDAILKSAIGKTVNETVNRLLGQTYNNPIEQELQKVMAKIAAELIRDKFEAGLRDSIAAIVEQRFTKDVIDSITYASIDKIIAAAQR